MKLSVRSILPKNIPSLQIFGKTKDASFKVSSKLMEAALASNEDALSKLETSEKGLTTEEAEERIEKYGYNVIVPEKRSIWMSLLFHAVINPLVILLTAIGVISYFTGDIPTTIIIFMMVLLGLILRFVQEYKADTAAAKLKAMIHVTATVVRDGEAKEIPLSHVVQGDIIKLAAGDMIPADIRLLSCKDLFIIQSSLTGESLPVEKFETPTSGSTNGAPPVTSQSAFDMLNICFLGTSVESGSATAVVISTGFNTYLGGMAKAITGQQEETSFDKGVKRFTWLMIRFMAVMVPLVFVINVITKGNWTEAFLFSIAVAVGLTPEMLPMIVTVCLSKGAMAMSKKKVIIKRLNSIQNMGAMDVLCTDKTGTLTMDKVILEKHCDVVRSEDDEVLLFAYLNSHFQTGLRNVLDRAVLNHTEVLEQAHVTDYVKVDEIPFDFVRKVMSVVVGTPDGKQRMITKGAPEEMFARCTQFELDGELNPIEPILLEDLKEEFRDLSSDGFRVLAIGYKDLEPKHAYSKEDECELILKGYLAFLDPPKETAAPAIKALQKHGIEVKILTGDNDLVTKKICGEVGLQVDHIVLGGDIENVSDEELADIAEQNAVFARLSPGHKQRIVKALQSKGHSVGFMGDGINDAPALRTADVGVSVDSAVDIAKESADAILLEKNLMVLEEGVLEGRKVFANILKYVRMGASSNFGNMFSVVGASIFLPFLPMAPIQILTNNLAYDFSQVPIPTDNVDPEQIAKPRPWSIKEITRFILFIGPISSIFDYTTFFMMLYIFGCWDVAKESLFQTGWFVESLLTQTLIIHVIRTYKIPFIQSRASWQLTMTSIVIMIVGIILPFSPLASSLGFQPLPGLYFLLVALTLLGYTILTQIIKSILIKKFWI